ncbi:MAG: AraC family transcriptional regulator [Planctomycetota bacterium]|jgi:AraC-like DNA-binding protein|nr:AraC family transcriptional regulator [Planctomycetota bacterium]
MRIGLHALVVLEGLQGAPGAACSVPAWPALVPVHASIDDRIRGAGGQIRGEHCHAVFHAVVVTAGRGSFMLDGEVVPVTGPTLFLVDPWVPHSFQRAAGDDTVYSEVTFEARARGAPSLAESRDAPPADEVVRDTGGWSALVTAWSGAPAPLAAVTALPQDVAGGLRAAIAPLADPLLPQHPMGAALAQGYVAQTLFLLWRELVAAQTGPVDDDLDRARRFLDGATHRPVELGEVAAVAGLSAKHFGRAFKARFGVTPVAYHRAAALRRAATMLRSTVLPIKHIAEACGFGDVHYFSRRFTSRYGMPPGGYRREYR